MLVWSKILNIRVAFPMVALLANPIKDWGISVLQFDYFLDRFFSFFQFLRQKLRFFGFGVHRDLQIFRFLAFGFRFSRKILTGFRICYVMRFWFFLFDLFGNYAPPLLISNSCWTQMLSSGMLDKPIEISQGSLGSLRVAVPSPSPKVSWGGEGKPTRRVPLGTEHCQSFFIDATSKLVTKLQATCDWLI